MTQPQLEYVCELILQLDPAMVVGETAHGTRRIIPIVGGTVSGPQLKGEISDNEKRPAMQADSNKSF